MFDFSRIDADRTAAGNQTLVFGTETGKGGVWLENDTAKHSTDSLLYINVDDDMDAELTLRIHDGRAHTAQEYSQDDFVL